MPNYECPGCNEISCCCIETPIPQTRWSRDHWGLLMYCEARAVDHEGKLERKHLRISKKPTHGTRIKGLPSKDPFEDVPHVIVYGHDDRDVLAELEEAGYLVNLGSGILPKVQLTQKGWNLTSQLRQFRANGGKSWELFFDPCSKCHWDPAKTQGCPGCGSGGWKESHKAQSLKVGAADRLIDYRSRVTEGPSPKCDQCIGLGKNTALHPPPQKEPCYLCGHRCDEEDCCEGVA